MTEFDAIVVGSGPNGLTAAATIAVAGRSVLVVEASDTIGGALRSTSHESPGWTHDVGATIHGLAALSPAYVDLNLTAHGVEFLEFDVPLAHPLDHASGAVLFRDLDATVDALGSDGSRYRRLVGSVVSELPELLTDVMGPQLRYPTHPLGLARFGAKALPPYSLVNKIFRTPQARALVGGNAAHSFAPMHHPFTTGFGLVLAASAHATGWPVARGGSATIASALRAIIESHGGEIRTGHRAGSVNELPPHKVTLLDTSPSAARDLLGAALRPGRARRYRRFRSGPGAFKIDYQLSEAIPWSFAPAMDAGTVHVIGDYPELATAERQVNRGQMPDRPFLLVVQAGLRDPSRAPNGQQTAWVYAHVPNGYEGDASESIERQLERFAPGFLDIVIDAHVSPPRDLEKDNANLIGGDIGGGAYSGLQTLRRPILSSHPYRTGAPGVYLCSASTPPGAGAHGMSGRNAALDALARELR